MHMWKKIVAIGFEINKEHKRLFRILIEDSTTFLVSEAVTEIPSVANTN